MPRPRIAMFSGRKLKPNTLKSWFKPYLIGCAPKPGQKSLNFGRSGAQNGLYRGVRSCRKALETDYGKKIDINNHPKPIKSMLEGTGNITMLPKEPKNIENGHF